MRYRLDLVCRGYGHRPRRGLRKPLTDHPPTYVAHLGGLPHRGLSPHRAAVDVAVYEESLAVKQDAPNLAHRAANIIDAQHEHAPGPA